MRPPHPKVVPPPLERREVEVVHALPRDVFVHPYLPSAQHVLDRAGELVHLQQQQDLLLQFLKHPHDLLVVFGRLCHDLIAIVGWVEVEQTATAAVEFLLRFAGEDCAEHLGIGGAQLSCRVVVVFGVIQNESQPELVVIFDQRGVHLLVKPVVEDNQLVPLFRPTGHQIAGMRISMHEALLVDHLGDHIGEQPAHLPAIDPHPPQLFWFVEVNPGNKLHDQHPPGGPKQQLRH